MDLATRNTHKTLDTLVVCLSLPLILATTLEAKPTGKAMPRSRLRWRRRSVTLNVINVHGVEPEARAVFCVIGWILPSSRAPWSPLDSRLLQRPPVSKPPKRLRTTVTNPFRTQDLSEPPLLPRMSFLRSSLSLAAPCQSQTTSTSREIIERMAKSRNP